MHNAKSEQPNSPNESGLRVDGANEAALPTTQVGDDTGGRRRGVTGFNNK
jgi:hypothetical protein